MFNSLNKGIKRPKRAKRSKKKGEGSALGFILLTIGSFAMMIGYVWLNNEVTATLNDISSLNRQLSKDRTAVDLLDAEIAHLSRSDRITDKAKNELNMVFPDPEPVRLAAKVK
ncbi:MAG: hypothetical protein IIC40_09170 [Candidatus Marinimicrobia bacterium]|nr:hypothetical protein [Candidatus Neomarinimicrobiota bacterium]